MADRNLRRTGTGGGGTEISRHATVPLPQTLFLPRDPGRSDIGVAAFRLLTIMLWHAWETMRTEPFRRHRMAVCVAREFVSPRSEHASTDQIWSAMAQLVEAGIVGSDDNGDVPAKGTDTGPAFRLLPPPKSSTRRQAEIEFVLTEAGYSEFGLAGEKGRFVILPLDVLLSARSMPVVRLCLLLLQYSGRKTHWIDMTPTELCDTLGLAADNAYRRNFSQLRDNVVRPAVDALTQMGGVEVVYLPEPDGRRLRVRSIHFAALRKTTMRTGYCLHYEGPGFVTITEEDRLRRIADELADRQG